MHFKYYFTFYFGNLWNICGQKCRFNNVYLDTRYYRLFMDHFITIPTLYVVYFRYPLFSVKFELSAIPSNVLF